MTRAVVAAVFAFVPLLAETFRSARNERRLTRRGAVAATGDVYPVMAVAYPGLFALMALEGWWWGRPISASFFVGLAVWTASKALKYAAIRALGERWTFRVLVLPGAALVTTGPYAILRHPNYVAVAGELVGIALLAWAPVIGIAGGTLFGMLLRARIAVEEPALGRDR
jgi:methyltransferase